MKTIYVDSDFMCHTAAAEGRMPIETDAFDGKFDAYIEGYRVVPDGAVWTRPDGATFAGEMIAPAVDMHTLLAAQGAYEQARAESDEALCDVAEMALENLLAVEMLRLGGDE